MFARLKILSLLLALVGLACAESVPTPAMRVGLEADARPLSFSEPAGRPIGYSVDLIDAIAREMGFSVVYSRGSWDKIFADFKAGELDVLPSLVYTTERDRFVDYSVPHVQLKGAAFLPRDGPILRAESSLAALRVAVVRDDFTHEFLRRRGWDKHLLFVQSLPEALQAVNDRRCDAVLATGLVGSKIIRDLRLPNVVASEVPFPELAFDLHLGVHAGDADRLAVLNAGLARIRANGVYDRIYEKWIGSLHPRDLRPMDLQPFVVPGFLGLLGLATLFLWQRRHLKRIRDQALALRASEEQLKLVLEVGAHGLWDYDFTTDRTRRDNWASVLTGYTEAELDAGPHRWRQLIHPEDLVQIKTSDRHIAKIGHDDVVQDYRVKTKHGEWRWISSRGKVVARRADGSPQRTVGTNTDITHLKHAETERAQLQAKMLEAQKLESLGVLAGGIAHDFNNLLAIILGNAGLAKLDLPAGKTEIAQNLVQIENATRRAADLCSQMLAYAGHGALVHEKVSLTSLVTDTTELLHLSISKNATLTFDLQADASWVEADRAQLQQVVMNLVINASEALGSQPGTIRLATGHGTVDPAQIENAVYRPKVPAGEFAWLEVADTGCGMSPEVRDKIFEPFYTTKFTGRGLGLAAVLGIVRAHEGICTLHSETDRGSTFRLYLPATTPTAKVVPPLPVAVPARQTGTVLVADDEPTVLSMATRTLEKQGYRVVQARDGREAVEAFAVQPDAFCAVLIDLTMPVLDGAQALSKIRALRPSTPLLVMSGYGKQETLLRLRDIDRVDFLTKPFSTDELLAAIMQAQTK